MECNIYKTIRRVGVSDKDICRVVLFVFSACKKKDPVVSVHFVGDKKIRTLNKLYRKKDKATDVLSFAVQEGGKALDKHEWGDIFISVPYIRRQAVCLGVSYKEELFRLLIHGILHLVGYDHETIEQEKEMFGLQDRMLGGLMNG